MPGLIADPENFTVLLLWMRMVIDSLDNELYRKDKVYYVPDEKQVNGSLARYNVPMYKQLHYLVRKEVEKRLGYGSSSHLFL
jgi:hypothetical protein